MIKPSPPNNEYEVIQPLDEVSNSSAIDREIALMHEWSLALRKVNVLEGFLQKAHDAIKGAEVLAECLAETKGDYASWFRENNDNFIAIRDILREWPTSLPVPNS